MKVGDADTDERGMLGDTWEMIGYTDVLRV